MVFVILQSRVVDKVDIACVGVGLEGGNKVFMNGVVVAVYPASPPPNNSRQCLRITASTCLLRVIIDYQYCRVSPNGFAPTNEIFHASLLKGAAHQRGAKSACEVDGYLYHKSQVRLKSDNDGLRGSLLDTPPPHRAVTVGARLLTRDNPICRISQEMLSYVGR